MSFDTQKYILILFKSQVFISVELMLSAQGMLLRWWCVFGWHKADNWGEIV